MSSNQKDHEKIITDLTRRFAAVVAIVIGVSVFVIGVILGASNPTNNQTQNLFSLVMASVGTLIATEFAVGLFSLPIQRSFIREVLGQVNLSENIRQAGLERVVMQQNSLDWGGMFHSSRRAQMFS